MSGFCFHLKNQPRTKLPALRRPPAPK